MSKKLSFAALLLQNHTEDIKVYKLSHSGKREEEIPVEKLSNGYSYFKADGKTYKTPYFEIVK